MRVSSASGSVRESNQRVLVITPIFPLRQQPYRGQANYQIVRALQTLTEVEVICILARYPDWFPPTFDYRLSDPTFCPPDVATHYVEYPAIPGFTRWFNGAVCANYAEPLARALRPSVILNFWLYPEGYGSVLVGRRLGVPVIVGSIGSDLNRIADPISRFLTRHTLKRADFAITKSRHLRQQAIRLGASPKKVRAILNGCDTTVFKPLDRLSARKELGIREEGKHVVYVGRLDSKKGTGELLEAVAPLAHSGSTRLTFVGDGPAEPMLQKRAVELGIAQWVRFEPACSSVKVANWIASSNVLSLPSHAEGCPSAIIEALSCGRPVVASDVGGIPEILTKDCGALVPPGDVGALTLALQGVLRRAWDEQEIAQRFRRGWDQVAKEIFEVCCGVTDKPTGGEIGRSKLLSAARLKSGAEALAP